MVAASAVAVDASRAGAASRAALETPEVLEGLQLTTPSMTSVVKVAILQTARIRVGIMLASRAELKGVGRAVEASTTQRVRCSVRDGAAHDRVRSTGRATVFARRPHFHYLSTDPSTNSSGIADVFDLV